MAYDNSTTGTSPYSHTTAGTNRILVVGVYLRGTDPVVSGVTYNGVACTTANANRTTANAIELWYLLNPASGANNVAFTTSGTVVFSNSAALSFKGMNQVGPELTASGSGASVITISNSVSTIAKNSEVVSMLGALGTVAGIAPTNSATTKASVLSGNAPIAISFKAEGAPGATTAGWDRNDSNTNYMGQAVAAFAPLQITIASGSYSVGNIAATFKAAHLITLSVASCALTLFTATFRKISRPATISGHSATVTNRAQHTGSVTNRSGHTASVTDQTQH